MGKFTSLACRGVQRRSLWQGQLITDQRWQPTCCQSLYGSPGASWQDKRSGTRCLHLVYLVCQICGCDITCVPQGKGLCPCTPQGTCPLTQIRGFAPFPILGGARGSNSERAAPSWVRMSLHSVKGCPTACGQRTAP